VDDTCDSSVAILVPIHANGQCGRGVDVQSGAVHRILARRDADGVPYFLLGAYGGGCDITRRNGGINITVRDWNDEITRRTAWE
jgi:hypothetical protein